MNEYVAFSVRNTDMPQLVFELVLASIRVSMVKRITEYPTRAAIVEEDWGDELDTFSFTGQTRGMWSDQQGLTIRWNAGKTHQDFLDVLDLYKTNGMLYDSSAPGVPIKGDALTDDSDTGPSLVMTCRFGTFIGKFTTFDYDDVAEKPFNVALSFEFKALRAIWRI